VDHPGAAAFRRQDRLRRRHPDATAFGSINDSLSFFRNNYDAFAAFRAAIIRLHGLVDAKRPGRALPTVLVKPSEGVAVELAGIEVRTPAGDQLIDSLM